MTTRGHSLVRDRRLVGSTTIAGYPLQLATVSMDPFNTGNRQIHIEMHIERADNGMRYVAGRRYESRDAAERAAEAMLEMLRGVAESIQGHEPPAAD